MMAAIAFTSKAALDVGPLLYLIIVVIWIASAIRSAARAAARQRRAMAESSRPTTAASSQPPMAQAQPQALASRQFQAQTSQQQLQVNLQVQLQQLRRQLAQPAAQPPLQARATVRVRRPSPPSAPVPVSAAPREQSPSVGLGYAAPSVELPPPDVPVALQLKDAVAAFGGAATPQEALVGGPPASLATDYAAPTPLTRLTPLTTQNAVVNAIVGAAVLGPCAAYRTSNQDLIGW